MDATRGPDEHGEAHDRAREVEVQVRRTPRYGVFMALGALLGTLVAWGVSAAMGPGVDAEGVPVDTTPVIGLSLVVGFVVGTGLGGLVAILLDRALSRRSRTLVAEQTVVDDDEEPEAELEQAAPAAPEAGAREPEAPAALDDPAGPEAPAGPDRPREG